MDLPASIPVPAALRGRETGNLYAKCGTAASADGAGLERRGADTALWNAKEPDMKDRARHTKPDPQEIEKLRARVEELEAQRPDYKTDGASSEQERQFHRMLMDASPAFFVAIDAKGRTVRMNNSMLDVLGYTAEEVENTDYMSTFVPERDHAELGAIFARLVRDKRPTFNENRVLTKSGDELLVEWHGRPVIGDDGEFECFFGVGINITEHRRAQDELRSRRDEAQEYLDLAGVVFLGLDRDGCVTLVNRKGCELLGGSESDITGRNWFDTFIPEKNRQQVREVFDGLISSEDVGELPDYEHEILTLGGERKVIEWHNAVERDAEGHVVGTMSSGIDVTERKRAEDVQRLAYRIGSSIHTAGNMDELFARIRDALGEVMNTENFFIALHNRENDTLSLSYFVDEHDQDDFDSFPAGKTLTGYLIKHDTSLLVTREELDKWSEEGRIDIVGTPSLIWLGVPLRVSGEVVGALVVQSYDDKNEFGEADKEMLEFVSEQIGFAIEHTRAENELKASEAKNRAILNAVPDMMFRIDRNGIFRSYDAPGDAPLAMPPEAFLDKHVREVFPPPFAEQVEASVAEVFRTSEMQLLEYSIPIPSPNGNLRDFEARMVLSGDDTVLGVVRDITERTRADRYLKTINEAALRMEQQMKLDEIFAAAAAGLAEVGLTGTLFALNEAGDEVTLMYTSMDSETLRAAEKLLGVRLSDMTCEVDQVDAFRAAVHERQTVFIGDMVEFLRQGLPLPKKKFAPPLQRAFDRRRVILAPLIADDRVFGALAVASDKLTERDTPAVTAFANQLSAAWRKATLMKELELSLEELRETQDQLLQSQKMEAVGRLAGGVAHDFNNLLTAISGYAELLSCDTCLSESVHGDIDQIRKAAGQAATLTGQLLAFSRRQPLQPVVIDLNKIVVNTDAMLHRLIGEDIELITTLDEASCQAKADPGQLEQVMINLAVNARDAMPEGGKLTIATRNVVLDSKACATIHDARPGRFVCLSIEDTGSGIERDIIDQIFEPFFSTKGPAKGTGLGLAVVYGIIRQHGGWINVFSEPNQGTAFKVYLPSVQDPRSASKEPTTTSESKAARGTGQRILLVEDEEAVRELASRALKENGYVVFEAGAYEEALELFEREGGKFDLVFSDVVLPDKSGIRLIDDLLSRRPDLQILVSSGYTDQKSQWPVIQEKGFRFLQKPYSLVDLLGTIDELV
jgi:PAS domain S-box-containing protein